MIFQNVVCSNPGNISSSPVILPAQVLPEIAVILGGGGGALQLRGADAGGRLKGGGPSRSADQGREAFGFGWDENPPRRLKNMKDMNLGFVFETHLILFWKGFPCKIVRSLAGNS